MLVSVLSVPAMIMYGTSCFIFCLVALVLITCKIMGLLDSDPGQRLTPARSISQIMEDMLYKHRLFRFYRKRRVKVFDCFYT